MNGTTETKSEIHARIDEVQSILDSLSSGLALGRSFHGYNELIAIKTRLGSRMLELMSQLELAEEDLSASILRSHEAVCRAKNMHEKAAYGHNPAVYYSLAVAGEVGEMSNAIVKAMRNGNDDTAVLAAVCSELPDVIIYSYILAHVLDINLSKLVNEKIGVVIQRANDGYYGGPLPVGVPGALSQG